MARNHVFWVALGVSILFHLSMVTVFRVYILLPIQRTQYCTLDLVDPETLRPVLSPTYSVLKLPSFEEALAAKTTHTATSPLPSMELSSPGLPDTALPAISFATLELAELRRLRLRMQSIQLHTPQSATKAPGDAWALFVREISALQDAARRLSPFDQPLETVEEARPQPMSRPKEGLAVYIEWMSNPKDRDLVSSPLLTDTLWQLDPKTMTEPISLVFRVNARGDVTEVFAPLEDEQGIVAAMGKALLKYRFAPIEDTSGEDQSGTLTLAPDLGSTP
jgi:hypothetical protein